jgi:hypothetical protein
MEAGQQDDPVDIKLDLARVQLAKDEVRDEFLPW